MTTAALSIVTTLHREHHYSPCKENVVYVPEVYVPEVYVPELTAAFA